MSTLPYRLAVCAMLVLLSACIDRKSSHTEVRSRPFYPLNPGCTFDGKPGSTDDMSQLANAKVISDECYAAPTPKVISSRTFYPTNPGCTFDGKPGSSHDMAQMANAKVISDECYVTPKSVPMSRNSETSRTMYLSNPGCTIDGAPGEGADPTVIVRAKVVSEECFREP